MYFWFNISIFFRNAKNGDDGTITDKKNLSRKGSKPESKGKTKQVSGHQAHIKRMKVSRCKIFFLSAQGRPIRRAV